MRSVPTGPPMRPPDTMPTIAAAIATVAAPGTPACSNAGANASPVAGPPVSVTDPFSTPNSGCMPIGSAISTPITFWTTASTVESSRKITHLRAADLAAATGSRRTRRW